MTSYSLEVNQFYKLRGTPMRERSLPAEDINQHYSLRVTICRQQAVWQGIATPKINMPALDNECFCFLQHWMS